MKTPSRLRYSITAFILLIAPNGFAHEGHEGKGKRLEEIGRAVAAIEPQLRPEDQQTLNDYIAGLHRLLAKYQPPATPPPATTAVPVVPFTCLSNGQPGTYERFTPTDPASGFAFEKATALQTCKQLIAVRNRDLMCVSNGQPGTYEKFGLFDLAKKEQKGSFTDLKTCQQLVAGARGPFVCRSNGQPASYEKFHLFNRETNKQLGGETKLEQCLGSVPDVQNK